MFHLLDSHCGSRHREKAGGSNKARPRVVSLTVRISFCCGAVTAPRARCLMAKAWEDRPVVLRQIEQIGEKS
jgi:hypothetical protein